MLNTTSKGSKPCAGLSGPWSSSYLYLSNLVAIFARCMLNKLLQVVERGLGLHMTKRVLVQAGILGNLNLEPAPILVISAP
jgi:hypothetical protein